MCGYEQKITRIYDYGYTYDKRGNLVKEEEICSPTTTGPKNITIATYLYDETNRMVQGTNKAGEVSAYTFNGLGVRVGTELILKDNTHGYTDFHCQTPSVETGIEKPEVVKTDYVIDYTRLDIDQRVLMKSEQDGYDFFYTYGLDKLQVMTIGEGSNWWGQSIKKQAYFKTSQGRRFVDQLAGRTAHESKVGYVAATDFIKKQAAKDAELLATKQVDEVVWHFFRSADTQKIGPSAPLKKLLEDYGIKVVIYE